MIRRDPQAWGRWRVTAGIPSLVDLEKDGKVSIAGSRRSIAVNRGSINQKHFGGQRKEFGRPSQFHTEKTS
jgi:hypothetical protein